jgi:uncharacterized protein
MKSFITIFLLIFSNLFMNLAWYGHLKFEEWGWFKKAGLQSIIFISWGLAFFEYLLQVPANRIGFSEKGGPFSLVQLKVIQEGLSIITFVIFSYLFFNNQTLAWNHYLAFILIVLAVFLVFYKA